MQSRQQEQRLEGLANPLPRSVRRDAPFELLDGSWRFDLDAADEGLAAHWERAHQYRDSAIWPGSIEQHLLGTPDANQRAPWKDRVVAWSERDFEVPAAWIKDPSTEVQLVFGACGYETRVWLNGEPLKTVEGEEVHFGSYVSFSYPLPEALIRPVNRLTVRIAHSMDAELPRGKEESYVYQRGGIWYQTISGPVRSIWLEPVAINRLRTRVGVVTTVEDRLVEFNFTTRIVDPGSYTIRLEVTKWGASVPLAVRDFVLPLEAGEHRQRLTVELPHAHFWSPGEPALYALVARLSNAGGTLSQIEARFGLRKIEARGRRIFLNKQALYIDGILYQPYTYTYEQMRTHLLAMQELGCNLVRVHIAGIDPRIYDLADEIGMLLWVEVPSPHSSTERSRKNHWALLMRMLEVMTSHPSIVIWSLYNEDWGAEDIVTNTETRRYISECFSYMRVNYPELLVVDNDGWHHVSTDGRLESHILTAHVYKSVPAKWSHSLDALVEGRNDDVTSRPLVVGDPFFYAGQIPLLVSEWGGFGFSEYGGPEENQQKAEQIRGYKAELRRRPIAGDVYTQATSIEDENNGLINAETGTLLVPPGILRSPSPPSRPTR
jgi:beta-galactosidase/beta-glucuronidase